MKNYTDIRDAIFEELYAICKEDKDIVVLTADTGVAKLKDFATNIPNQFYNVGIAEQNAVSVSVGLSKVGKKVFVFGICNFIALRAFEQLRTDVCGMVANVKILGIGASLTYSTDGYTHHSTEDLAAVNTLPNITIYNPSDYNMAAGLVHYVYNSTTPCYLRLDKGPFNKIYNVNDDFDSGITLHGSSKYKVAIVTTGITTTLALKIAETTDNIAVIDLYKIKPLNRKLLAKYLEPAKVIIAIEEQQLTGGIGDLVSSVMIEHQIYKPLKRFGIADKFIKEVGSREYLRELNGMGEKNIVESIEYALQTIK